MLEHESMDVSDEAISMKKRKSIDTFEFMNKTHVQFRKRIGCCRRNRRCRRCESNRVDPRIGTIYKSNATQPYWKQRRKSGNGGKKEINKIVQWYWQQAKQRNDEKEKNRNKIANKSFLLRLRSILFLLLRCVAGADFDLNLNFFCAVLWYYVLHPANVRITLRWK